MTRTNRALLAWKLKRFPQEVDVQPAPDIWDLFAAMEDEAIRSQQP